MSGGVHEVVVFTRAGCGLCREAERLVAEEAADHVVRLVDVDEDDELQRAYNVRVPVVVIDGVEVAECVVAPGVVAAALRDAGGRGSSRSGPGPTSP